MAAKARKHGVFCIEGNWYGDLMDNTTIAPALELLSKLNGVEMPYRRYDVATLEELKNYLSKWSQKKYGKYPILYLGFHGDKGIIQYADSPKATMKLAELQDLLQGRCKGRILHFASCGTLSVHGKSLKAFANHTGALAVTGYRMSVNWIAAAAFELLLFEAMSHYTLTRTGMHAVERAIHDQCPDLIKSLGFRMVISSPKP